MERNGEGTFSVVSSDSVTEAGEEANAGNERIEKEETSRLNVEVLDDEVPRVPGQTVYQIRPQLHEKFKPLSAKEVIHTVLFDQLSAKTYNATDAVQWTKDIADTIRERVKELKFNRYKYIVNVVLGEQHGAGVKMGTRCIWDAEADTYAYDSFLNVRIARIQYSVWPLCMLYIITDQWLHAFELKKSQQFLTWTIF